MTGTSIIAQIFISLNRIIYYGVYLDINHSVFSIYGCVVTRIKSSNRKVNHCERKMLQCNLYGYSTGI